MDRRDALKALGSLPAGITLQPVTIHDAGQLALIVITFPGPVSQDQAIRLRDYWEVTMAGTPVEGVKVAVVSDGARVEFVRR